MSHIYAPPPHTHTHTLKYCIPKEVFSPASICRAFSHLFYCSKVITNTKHMYREFIRLLTLPVLGIAKHTLVSERVTVHHYMGLTLCCRMHYYALNTLFINVPYILLVHNLALDVINI